MLSDLYKVLARISIIFLCLLATTQSNAVDFTGIGLFVGGNISDISAQGDEFEENSSGYQLYGGYNFTTNFALEVSTHDLGNYGEFPLTVDISGYSIDLVGIYPVNERIDVFAKAGNLWWTADYTLGFSAADSLKSSNWFYSVGGSYETSYGFDLTLSYARTTLDSDESVQIGSITRSFAADLDFLTFGLEFKI